MLSTTLALVISPRENNTYYFLLLWHKHTRPPHPLPPFGASLHLTISFETTLAREPRSVGPPPHMDQLILRVPGTYTPVHARTHAHTRLINREGKPDVHNTSGLGNMCYSRSINNNYKLKNDLYIRIATSGEPTKKFESWQPASPSHISHDVTQVTANSRAHLS